MRAWECGTKAFTLSSCFHYVMVVMVTMVAMRPVFLSPLYIASFQAPRSLVAFAFGDRESVNE